MRAPVTLPVATGQLIVDVAESHHLSNLALVHRRSEAGQTHGKIIIFP